MDIFKANLELYNVITIFLTSTEIREVLDLLNFKQQTFKDTIDELGDDKRSRYHYYLVGSVAAGKSTILENLRCFETNEEWTRSPPKEMYLSIDKLDVEQSKKVDTFVFRELKEKNFRMYRAGVGFHFVDRAPLDFYAFSKDDAERKEKTEKLDALVTRDMQLHPGEIVFIRAKGKTLVERNLRRGRPPEDAGNAVYLDKQTANLEKIYKPNLVLHTDNQSAGEIAKRIVRHALFEKYTPTDLGQIMEKYR